MNYLGCMLDESMSGETMALRVIEKINSRLKFLYWKNRFLDVPLHRLLCNVLIQPHFDYACTTWYPNLSKKLKISCKLHKTNALDFAWNYKVGNIYQMNISTNWNGCQWIKVSNNNVLRPAENMRIDTRNSFLKLNHPFRKTSTGQKGLSYIGPAIWNRIPEIIKKTRNLNTFKHKMKHYYLNDFSNPSLWNVGRCYPCHTVFHLSNIAININFFLIVVNFSFFKKSLII